MTFWLEDDLTSKKLVIKRAALLAMLTLFVLFVFQPFGTSNSTVSFKFLRLSGYAIVTFCGMLLSGALEIMLNRYLISQKQRVLVILPLYIVIAAVFNHSYFVVAVLGAWHWQNQLLFVFFVSAIGLFPAMFLYLATRQSNMTPPLCAPLMPKTTSQQVIVQEPVITLTGDNKGDKLQVCISQILFMKSADNYCEITIFANNKLSNKLLRSSLSGILKQIPANPMLMRCHRSYAVNLALVKNSSGNAGGLQLLMNADAITVPVSRSYVDVIKKALSLITSDE